MSEVEKLKVDADAILGELVREYLLGVELRSENNHLKQRLDEEGRRLRND